MKRICAALLVFCLMSAPAPGEEIDLFSTPAPEGTDATCPMEPLPELSVAPLLEAPPIALNCASALLLEPESGQILFEMNADVPRPVASVTKVMTILLTLEAIEQGRIGVDQTLTISESAAGMGGSQVLLDVGEMQSVDVLLKSMIVGSANDACVALADALQKLVENGKLKTNPMKGMVAAVSVGIVNGEAICDLEYVEDSAAETDMNVVMTEDGRIIEVQGTAEGEPFTHEELLTLLALARGGIESIVATQKAALAN